MDFIEGIDPSTVKDLEKLGESNLFVIYAAGDQTYLLVQRHSGIPWTGLRFSGDGVFRIASLLGDAMRHLYRDLASHLSPNYLTETREPGRTIPDPDDLLQN